MGFQYRPEFTTQINKYVLYTNRQSVQSIKIQSIEDGRRQRFVFKCTVPQKIEPGHLLLYLLKKKNMQMLQVH